MEMRSKSLESERRLGLARAAKELIATKRAARDETNRALEASKLRVASGMERQAALSAASMARAKSQKISRAVQVAKAKMKETTLFRRLQLDMALSSTNEPPMTDAELLELVGGDLSLFAELKEIGIAEGIIPQASQKEPAKLGQRLKAMGTTLDSVPAIQALGISTIELTDEEKAMNGAPEGELFVVQVLPRDQLPCFDVPSILRGRAALAMLMSQAQDLLSSSVKPTLVEKKGSSAWNVEFEAITSLRRVLLHAPAALATKATPGVLEAAVPALARACRSLRSAVAKNAITASGELFLTCHNSVDDATRSGVVLVLSNCAADLDGLVGALIDSCASTSAKHLRIAAAEALDQVKNRTVRYKFILTALATLSPQISRCNICRRYQQTYLPPCLFLSCLIWHRALRTRTKSLHHHQCSIRAMPCAAFQNPPAGMECR